MNPNHRTFKARVARARCINRAVVLIAIVTAGSLTGYFASTIGKVAQ